MLKTEGSVSRDRRPPPDAIETGAEAWRLDAALLFLVYVLSYMDRQMLVLLAHSIGKQLQIGPGTLASVYGTAFGVMFAVSGLLAGPIAARFPRLRWIAVALVVWSAGTVATAFVQGLAGLWLARIALALGEAAAVPAILALIADRVPRRHWAAVSAFVIGGSFVGAGLAFSLSGVIAARPDPNAWRGAFEAVGLAGLPLAGMLWLRGRSERKPAAPESARDRWPWSLALLPFLFGVALLPPGWMEPSSFLLAAIIVLVWMRDLRRNRPVAAAETIDAPGFRCFLAAFTGILFVDAALLYWVPTLAEERFAGMESRVGVTLGLIGIVVGWAAAVGGGWAADRADRRWVTGRLVVALAAFAVEGLAGFGILFAERLETFVALYALLSLGSGAWVGSASSIGLGLVSPPQRTIATGVYFLSTVLGGLALGPLAVGFLVDHGHSMPTSLTPAWIAALAALGLLMRLARYLPAKPAPAPNSA